MYSTVWRPKLTCISLRFNGCIWIILVLVVLLNPAGSASVKALIYDTLWHTVCIRGWLRTIEVVGRGHCAWTLGKGQWEDLYITWHMWVVFDHLSVGLRYATTLHGFWSSGRMIYQIDWRIIFLKTNLVRRYLYHDYGWAIIREGVCRPVFQSVFIDFECRFFHHCQWNLRVDKISMSVGWDSTFNLGRPATQDSHNQTWAMHELAIIVTCGKLIIKVKWELADGYSIGPRTWFAIADKKLPQLPFGEMSTGLQPNKKQGTKRIHGPARCLISTLSPPLRLLWSLRLGLFIPIF
jgi:hypothetical protein